MEETKEMKLMGYVAIMLLALNQMGNVPAMVIVITMVVALAMGDVQGTHPVEQTQSVGGLRLVQGESLIILVVEQLELMIKSTTSQLLRNKHISHFSQVETMDCGPASLKMIAKYYGKSYTVQTLRERCFITREGVSMQGISDAAEYIGFRTLGVRMTLEQLANEAPLPCILHWNQNHFVVCYKIKQKKNGDARIYIADPASQKLVYQKEEFLKCWISTTQNNKPQGLALLLEPGPEFNSIKDEPTSTRRDLLFFLRYFLPYKKQIAWLLLLLLAGSGVQMLFPFLTQALVDKGVNGKDLGMITLILIAQLVFFFSQMMMSFVRSWITLHMNAKINIALISDFLMKLMRLPLHYFDTKKTGDIMQRIGDHSRIKQFLMGSSMSIIFSVFNFFVYAAILGYYHLPILGLFLLGNTFYVLWILYFMQYRKILDTKRFNLSATEQSNIVQLVQGMQEIKLNNCERQRRWEWESIQQKLFKINVKSLKLGQTQQIGSLFFSEITNILITFLAAKTVVEGGMTLGMMMSLTYIIGQVSAPIREFITFAQTFQDAKISIERLNEIHQKEDEEQSIEGKLVELPDDKTITLDHVSFSYSGAQRGYALEDVSLVIPDHKVTAIVGSSGSGKTTLIKLIQGFYEPLEGEIRVGGIMLNMINPHLWRSKTGSVMQDGFIFSDSIERNIAVTDDQINSERLHHAIEVANIGDYIESLPLRQYTKIGSDGNGLSQGQRQRILIARAVYKAPEYIFLDEATNALDAKNERTIMENLQAFYRGKTVVIAAHRLSTVKNADNIIVLEKGKIVEQGTHLQLIKRKGTYFNLVKNQLELRD